MSNIKSVCVYCGSSNQVDQDFKDAAAVLGKSLAENGMRTVYGGGHVGLMGIVADTAIQNGGEVIGIIPRHIADKEVAHTSLTELHVVETMHERKQMMVDNADAFLILPGGLGTMDEFFEIFTWWQLGLHDKPIIVVNLKGYWTPLIKLIENIVAEGFARAADLNHMIVVDDINDVQDALANAKSETIDPQTKWI